MALVLFQRSFSLANVCFGQGYVCYDVVDLILQGVQSIGIAVPRWADSHKKNVPTMQTVYQPCHCVFVHTACIDV